MHHIKHVKFVFATIVALLAVLAVGPLSLVYASSLVLVSGPSPYASCSIAGQPGTNYLNAEVEPCLLYTSPSPRDS